MVNIKGISGMDEPKAGCENGLSLYSGRII
jgi:hypothetical protein